MARSKTDYEIKDKTDKDPLADAVFSQVNRLNSMAGMFVSSQDFLLKFRAGLEALESMLFFCAPFDYGEKKKAIVEDLKKEYLNNITIGSTDTNVVEICKKHEIVLTDESEGRKLYWELLLKWYKLISSSLIKSANIVPDRGQIGYFRDGFDA